MQYLVALTSILLGAVAQLFLKMGVTAIQERSGSTIESIKYGFMNLYMWTGLCLYGASLGLWFFVLSRMELSKAYPMVSLGYVFTLFLGYFFLNESLTVAKVAGISLILVGVLVLSR
ncbi:MAG: hypothetical protein EOO89_17010 [Pedobacter sp.]|nr:MAG: hypothetical protein EOO89_17010 [Pedobacter sp.]